MKIEGEYNFSAPRDAVWDVFRDPEILSMALPGTQKFDQISENEFEGKMQVRIGPVSGTFSGKLTVTNEVPPESCTLTVEGTGKIGFLKGTGDVDLFEQSDGKTLMKYKGEVQIGGRVASVGQRLFDTVSKSMIKQGLNKLNEILLAG